MHGQRGQLARHIHYHNVKPCCHSAEVLGMKITRQEPVLVFVDAEACAVVDDLASHVAPACVPYAAGRDIHLACCQKIQKRARVWAFDLVLDDRRHVEHHSQSLLTDQGMFPNFEFLRALKKSLDGDRGTIFRWAAHENTILNHIKDQLTRIPQAPNDKDELIQFIESITNDAERSMVDLNEIALKCYFHPSTQGRTSLKKVLPAVLQSSEILKSEYSTPIGPYPASLNFPADFIWYQLNDSQIVDPYDLLKQYAEKLFKEINPTISQENRLIADGGAAAMAYARLQFEKLPDDERQRINASLLRYCELDTLAMVMIMKAWIDWS